jgi:tetratricopeptide (TPR) repeat protein/transglutaminase-like putative cysteine protease
MRSLRSRVVAAVAVTVGMAGPVADLRADPAPRATAAPARATATPAEEVGPIHPDLLRAAAAVRSAKGPEVYAALRELWRTWDRADPTHVEEAIASVVEDAGTPPAVKVYAELLRAYARRRRGDLDGAQARVDALGFVRRWMSIGPFDNENKEGHDRVFGPEVDLREAIVPGRAYDGKERPVRWRVPPDVAHYGWFDFGDLVRPRENVCAYATTFVRAKAGTKAPRPISLWLGAEGAAKVFWNGEEVLADAGYRDLDVDRLAAEVTLAPGTNRLLVKVCGGDDAPKFALRVGDDKGAPDLGVEEVAEPEASVAAIRNARKPAGPAVKLGEAAKQAKPAAPKPGRLVGPLQAFERAASGGKPGPALLEAYARYLFVTGGDSKAEHKARDLARRAAEAEPTVARLLLAGQLAEDRNQQREWIEKADALVGPKHDDLDVLLAKAQLAQTGINWREAVPIYERVLAMRPDHVAATLGLVDLYVEAGLKRTALGTLERAVTRQSTSVALLRAYATQLRALGRDTEASEVEARYAALRFDDSGFLSQLVELAVARRDAAGAERWLERFLRSEPDSAWARGLAARTYRALGQNDRALAGYQRALALAPEDVPTLRALSDLYGEQDQRDKQLELLRQILAISPQAKDVREYVEHIEPPKPRADEAYAWASERFLPMRTTPAQRWPKRTLRNLTVTTVFPNGLASRFRQVVFQPLTDEAAAGAREYAFEYQGERQTVALRAAKVYRADGKVDEAIESGEGSAHDPDLSMYTSQRTFYVHFPRLNAGDVVELRYRVEDVAVRNEIADYFGEVEYLQSDEPVASSEYVVIMPKAKALHTFASPLPGLVRDVKDDGDRRIYTFAATDVPPAVPEPAMPPWSETLAHVHVSTFDTWAEVGAWYWGLVREQFDVDDEVRRVAREITKGLTDDRAKVRAVYKYATHTRYVALEFGIEGIRPRRCAQTLARGWGDCKDKATLIVTLLRELGIPSTIVLLRTRLRGDIEPEPASLAPFDHAIAYVPSLDLYLDGTAEHSGSGELPAMDRGAIGLAINEGKAKLVRLPNPPPEDSVVRRRIEATVVADGSAQFSADATVTGAFAAQWRQRYLAEASRADRATRDLSDDLGPVELAAGKAGVEVSDVEDVEQPVHLRAKGRAPTFARKEGELLSMPAGPPVRLVAEFAPLSTRTHDVVLRALTTREDEWTLRLPPGAKVQALPSPQQLDGPYGRFSITVEQANGKLVVKSSLALKKPRIAVAEYGAFRAFCEAADRAFGQRVVVGK